MRFPISNFQFPISRRTGKLASPRRLQIGNWQLQIGNTAAFTMIEIAICLAIIGFALVAIIGVLPLGMNTQRDNREETVINQDATVLLGAIRDAARGADYLTNYVYAITNYCTNYFNSGPVGQIHGYGPNELTNGAIIIGLLSTPEFTDNHQAALYMPLTPPLNKEGSSNHVVAYVRSMSGIAAEKPPQNNQIMQDDTFSYRVYVVNAPMPTDTNNPLKGFAKQIAGNQRELRMTFLWPQLPNGNVGNGRQAFRMTIAGQLSQVPNTSPLYPDGYFYQPQFTNAP